MSNGNNNLCISSNTHKWSASENLQGKSKRIQTKSASVETSKSNSIQNSLKNSFSTDHEEPLARAESPLVVNSMDSGLSNHVTDLSDDLTEDNPDDEINEDEELAWREPRTPSKKKAVFKKADLKMTLVATKSRDSTLKKV